MLPTVSAQRQPKLVADIGGSNIRLGWLDGEHRAVQHVRQLKVADFPSPVEAVRAYLDDIRADCGTAATPPRRAAFAVATPVAGDLIDLTNGLWRFSTEATRVSLGLDELLMLNDFAALAYSLPDLGPDQLRAHGGVMPRPQGTLAVIGPGTGLGVAGLVETSRGWVVVAGEGGHATLAAGDDFEAELLAVVRREHPHVSAERVLSGIGLPALCRAVASVQGGPVPSRSTEEIVALGLAQSDPVCDRTLDVFCALLGSFAGNVALTLGARGGVYIGGGIVPRLGERFFASAFRQRFEAKGRFQSYLAEVPTAVITDTLTALVGAARAIDPPTS